MSNSTMPEELKRFAILYVDDEEKSLKSFERAFSNQFRILTAANAAAGFEILQTHKDDIGVLMTDQRMPGQKGVELLEKTRQLRPRVIRILVTAYSDFEAVIQAVNTGAIYKYVSKPWDVNDLGLTLRHALQFFMVQRERDQFLKEKLALLQKMVISDRIISLGILASGIGHYVRNSLTAVKTFLDLAPEMLRKEKVDLEKFENTEFWKDFYEQVKIQVKRINELLSQLGEASSEPAFRFEDKIDLKKSLDASIAKLKPELDSKKIQVANDMPSGLPEITVDKAKFQALFELLLKDAMTSLPPNSRIWFRAKAVEGAEPQVLLEVEDTGPGLSKEALKSIFDPFFLRQENPQEFGVNLMVCYFIVYHHGGTIEVQSKQGSGLIFNITLPVQPKPRPGGAQEHEILNKVLVNDKLLEKLWTGS